MLKVDNFLVNYEYLIAVSDITLAFEKRYTLQE
jgi:hypothetical protein